jgi:hypothetical protein
MEWRRHCLRNRAERLSWVSFAAEVLAGFTIDCLVPKTSTIIDPPERWYKCTYFCCNLSIIDVTGTEVGERRGISATGGTSNRVAGFVGSWATMNPLEMSSNQEKMDLRYWGM